MLSVDAEDDWLFLHLWQSGLCDILAGSPVQHILAHQLGLDVVAHGIQNIAQNEVRILARNGIDSPMGLRGKTLACPSESMTSQMLLLCGLQSIACQVTNPASLRLLYAALLVLIFSYILCLDRFNLETTP